MANKLKEAFNLDYAWEKDGLRDLLRFKRPGVSGDFTLDSEKVALHGQLGGLLGALKLAIERKVNQYFDEQFASEIAGEATHAGEPAPFSRCLRVHPWLDTG
jgi:hypothetical protein